MGTGIVLTAEYVLELVNSRNSQIDSILDDILPDLSGSLGELGVAIDNLNDVELPALELALAQAQIDLAENTTLLNTLNDVTLPALELDILALEVDLGELNTITLPGLSADLDDLELSLGTLNSKFPIVGTDISDGAISTPKMIANSIDGDRILANTLQAAKIVAGSISTDRMTANSINGDRILANTLQAAKIVAGSISTDRFTANTISGDIITVNSLHAGRIVAGSITTDRMTANTIHGDRITGGTINADKLVANTIQAVLVSAGAIDGITIHGTTLDNGKVLISDDDITIAGDPGRTTNTILMSSTAVNLGTIPGRRPGFVFDVDLFGHGGTTHTVGQFYFDNGFVSDVKLTATKLAMTDPTGSGAIPNVVIDSGGNVSKSTLNITKGADNSGGSGWAVLRVPN